MNNGLSKTIKTEDALDGTSLASSPTLGIIALRFVVSLAAIVAVFVWAWSR